MSETLSLKTSGARSTVLDNYSSRLHVDNSSLLKIKFDIAFNLDANANQTKNKLIHLLRLK